MISSSLLSLSSLKRTVSNDPMSIGDSPNTSIGPNMNVSSSPSSMRLSSSTGSAKSATVNMNPIDKSNSMTCVSRCTRRICPMSRSFHDKNIREHYDHELPYHRCGLASHGVPPNTISSSSLVMEPSADDAEGDMTLFSSRHMAAVRFQRNQHLLHELFNEVCIPDLRSNVTVDRILTLRHQVNALEKHRETFEKDLNELEQKHAEKKRKLIEANEKFHNDYAEASSKNLSQAKINEILQRYEAIEKLQKEKQLLLLQQQVHMTSPRTLSSRVTTMKGTVTTPVTKTEPVSTVEVPQRQIPTPVSSSTRTQLSSVPAPLSSQSVSVALSSSQPVPSQLSSSQFISTQSSIPHPIHSQAPSSHPVQSQSHSISTVRQQTSLRQQQSQSTSTSQNYPTMHPDGGYISVPAYGHPQYRSPVSQRLMQYPASVPWHQQRRFQTNVYDSRYYNPYPPHVQWSQQQLQQPWPPNQQVQQQIGGISQQHPTQIWTPPHQQQSQPYVNDAHYNYSVETSAWSSNIHSSQQYTYPQNPLFVFTSHQQQYHSPAQMHNSPQSDDYSFLSYQQMSPQQPSSTN